MHVRSVHFGIAVVQTTTAVVWWQVFIRVSRWSENIMNNVQNRCLGYVRHHRIIFAIINIHEHQYSTQQKNPTNFSISCLMHECTSAWLSVVCARFTIEAVWSKSSVGLFCAFPQPCLLETQSSSVYSPNETPPNSGREKKSKNTNQETTQRTKCSWPQLMCYSCTLSCGRASFFLKSERQKVNIKGVLSWGPCHNSNSMCEE